MPDISSNLQRFLIKRGCHSNVSGDSIGKPLICLKNTRATVSIDQKFVKEC